MVSTPDRLPAGPLTYEDYVEIPNDGRRYEILDGELFVTPAARPRHQLVSANLVWILEQHVRPERSGRIFAAPIDLILAPTTVAQPDVLFIRAGHEAIVSARGIEGAPDLVVEIPSPYSVRQDRGTKAALYARFGIPNYWILDPEERVFESYELANGEYRLATRCGESGFVRAAPFPDLPIPLAEIWDTGLIAP
jgi:Uma2 family endonuclease